jgi:hypothetical protein
MSLKSLGLFKVGFGSKALAFFSLSESVWNGKSVDANE